MSTEYIKKSCMVKCINSCCKEAAPEETFSNSFLKRDFLNKINNPDVNMNSSGVDYEATSNAPFKPPARNGVDVPPSSLGNSIVTTTDPIVKTTTPMVVSRADVPLADMIKFDYSVVGEYAKMVKSSLANMYDMLSTNDAISGIFRDNVKIISLLIAVATGSFILNSGISALVVGLILMFVMKNAVTLF